MVNLTTAEQLVIGKYANFSVYGFNILLDRIRAPFVVYFLYQLYVQYKLTYKQTPSVGCTLGSKILKFKTISWTKQVQRWIQVVICSEDLKLFLETNMPKVKYSRLLVPRPNLKNLNRRTCLNRRKPVLTELMNKLKSLGGSLTNASLLEDYKQTSGRWKIINKLQSLGGS